MEKCYFSSNIRKLRKEYKLSQEDLAARIGYSSKNISKWETGKALPNIEVLKQISLLFDDISIDKLLYENIEISKFSEIEDIVFLEKNNIKLTKASLFLLYDLINCPFGKDGFELTIDSNNYKELYFQKFYNYRSFKNIDIDSLLVLLNELKEKMLIDSFYVEQSDGLSNCIIVSVKHKISSQILYSNEIRLCDIYKYVISEKDNKYLNKDEYMIIKENSNFNKQTSIVLNIIENYSNEEFKLGDLYADLSVLKDSYPNSKSLKSTIRTAISVLKKSKLIAATEMKGTYKKLFSATLFETNNKIEMYSKCLQKDFANASEYYLNKAHYIVENAGVFINDRESELGIFKNLYDFKKEYVIASFINDVNDALLLMRNNGYIKYYSFIVPKEIKFLVKDNIVANYLDLCKKEFYIEYVK